MDSKNGSAQISTLLQDVVDKIPSGLVFDTSYVIGQLWAEHSKQYSELILTFPNGSEAMGAREVERVLKSLEPALLSEIDLKDHFPNMGDSSAAKKLWMKS
jgi:hypothetical protein